MSDLGPYPLNTVTAGDARQLSKLIPDESVDMIFTDPPYSKEFIPLYGWVANEAMRVLKPGGFCCFIAASMYLDEIFLMSRAAGLKYYFKVETINGKEKPLIWPRKVLNASKPVLMWTKGDAAIRVHGMVSVYNCDQADKRFHTWGQDVGSAKFVISYCLGDKEKSWLRPAVLLEPFAGGGATLEACKALGVDYVAFELDANMAATARARMKGYVPPVENGMPDLFPQFT